MVSTASVLRAAPLLALALLTSCARGSPEDEARAREAELARMHRETQAELGTPRPTLGTPPAPDRIVVDFEDGTTQEEIDAWEKAWGVDLTFNSIEGPEDGV